MLKKKAMKMRNKGKVHPSPSSSSSSHASHHNNKDALSVLKLLPAAILAIVSVLPLEDREVLAYMITRSIKTTNPPAFLDEKNKKNSKRSATHLHKTTPLFECECFDCYTSYWFRWDSSPNRELIHQAIEAFEEHLNNGEQSKKGKNKRKEKMGRRGIEKFVDFPLPEAGNGGSPEIQERSSIVPEDEFFLPESSAGMMVSESGESGEVVAAAAALIMVKEQEEEDVTVETTPETALVVRGAAPASNHKGLARKVLPDVLGLLNSRLWSLWSPNV